MKKRMLYLLVLAALALAACTPAAATEAPGGTSAEGLPDLGGREVTVAVENQYLPFNYIDPATGEAAGWDYEVWNEICRLLNCVPVCVPSLRLSSATISSILSIRVSSIRTSRR